MNKYKEAMELLPVLYEKQYLRINSLEICELVMKKALGIDISCEKVRNTEIVKKQIINYDINLAIEHIKEHSHDNDKGMNCTP